MAFIVTQRFSLHKALIMRIQNSDKSNKLWCSQQHNSHGDAVFNASRGAIYSAVLYIGMVAEEIKEKVLSSQL